MDEDEHDKEVIKTVEKPVEWGSGDKKLCTKVVFCRISVNPKITIMIITILFILFILFYFILFFF